MVDGGENHAGLTDTMKPKAGQNQFLWGKQFFTHLETNQHGGHDDDVHVAVMIVHVMNVVHGQTDEQKPTEYVTPYVDLNQGADIIIIILNTSDILS